MFARRDEKYTTIYSRDRAINELKKDRRVKSVKWTGKQMVIETKPITPQTAVIPKLIIAPVGEYTIKLSKLSTYFKSYIIRKGGIIHASKITAHIS